MPRQGWSIRRSQIVTTYGVGAMVPVGVESVMVAGTHRWPSADPDLHEPRLERQLHVNGFRRPPASVNRDDLPVVRFPKWVSCPNPLCEVGLNEHDYLTGKRENKCPECRTDLLPSRFVVACRRGHIEDFPYFWWAHQGVRVESDVQHTLSIDSTGTSSALRDIRVTCTCEAFSTMEGVFSRGALRGRPCRGLQPWLNRQEEGCDRELRTLQRGASNAWFPVLRSALSIPPWSEGIFKVLNRHWPVLRAVPPEAVQATIQSLYLNTDMSGGGFQYTVDDLTAAVVDRKRREDDPEEISDQSIRSEEFQALVSGRGETGVGDEFVCESADTIAPSCGRVFSRVMLVKRLLEVRALQGFTRIFPPSPGDPAEFTAPLSQDESRWLPAIDVSGEGVFLALGEQRLAEWERRPQVVHRIAAINANYRRTFEEQGRMPDKLITPRSVLVHTLAHILIGQWALDSGYPAASLRERLFTFDDRAGLLIYTATSDSAGSLGGVIQRGEGASLEASLREAVARARWCSSDPLCIEADAAGVDSLNLAACHACVLLPEVSCEEMNVFLDRAVIAGTSAVPELAFFEIDS